MKHSLRKISESVSYFIEKIYQILFERSNEEVIEWTPNGKSFVIKDIRGFESLILPKYFKHSNFSSFLRQLNMYNFHKVCGDKYDNQFQHQKFTRDHCQPLAHIRRKKNQLPLELMSLIETQPFPVPQLSKSSPKVHQNNGSKDEQHGKQNSQNDNLKLFLSQLQQKNQLLKKTKKKQQSQLKTFNSASAGFVSQKFYKLIACLITQKIKNQLEINSKSTECLKGIIVQDDYQKESILNFNEIVEHATNGNEPADFKDYQQWARTLIKKHTDQFFMLHKTRKQNNTQ